MSGKLIAAPQGLWGGPVGSNISLNDNIFIEALNNSGAHMAPGDVVIWDNNATAANAVSTTVNGAQQLAIAATSYLVASSAAFGTSGPIVAVADGGVNAAGLLRGAVPTVVSTPSPQNLFGYITAKADGTHITIVWSRAGAAGSLRDGTTLLVPPSTLSIPFAGQVALPGVPSAYVPAVTYNSAAAANNARVAGVVGAFTTGGSETSSQLYPPGGSVPIVVAGATRVNIGGNTVAAGALLGSDGTVSGLAAASTPTLGNLIGVALESQAAIDANNTIRAVIKLG